MGVKLGVVMDPIESITVKKDTTLAMLLAAQKARLDYPLYAAVRYVSGSGSMSRNDSNTVGQRR